MSKTVEVNRTIYTASDFAKESLIYLQEIGQSKALKKHTSSRDYLDSFLFFVVLDGDGIIRYKDKEYKLHKNSVVFIDCNNPYSHMSDNWTIRWIHINGINMKNIYNKYLSRNGKNVFISNNTNYVSLLSDIDMIAKSNDHTSDMQIYSKIVEILSLLMSETIRKDKSKDNKYNIEEIKKYIDDNYLNNLTLQDLSNIFHINKFYLTRLFKGTYSTTIIDYINKKIITKSKELLRYSDYSIEQISSICSINDSNYFSRLFKKIEGITPKEYRNRW